MYSVDERIRCDATDPLTGRNNGTPLLLTTEKIRALVDNIRSKKDRDIEGEVVKTDDDDG